MPYVDTEARKDRRRERYAQIRADPEAYAKVRAANAQRVRESRARRKAADPEGFRAQQRQRNLNTATS